MTAAFRSLFLACLLSGLAYADSSHAQTSTRFADISSKVLTVQKDHGEVTWFGFFFLAERFGDNRHSHLYPNMIKAYRDFKAELLGQGPFIWALVETEEDCRPANWDRLFSGPKFLMERMIRANVYWEYAVPDSVWPSAFMEHWRATYHQTDVYKNPWKARSFKVLSVCRKPRSFKKGEREFDVVSVNAKMENILDGALRDRLDKQAEESVNLGLSARNDMRLFIQKPGLGMLNWSDEVIRPDENERSATVFRGKLFIVERTADGDPAKPYYWKKDVALAKLGTYPPMPPASLPREPELTAKPSNAPTTFYLTARPDRASEWADQLKKGWADAALRDAETAARVATENAKSAFKSGEPQLDELTRQFCASADAHKSCSCRRPGAPNPRICPR